MGSRPDTPQPAVPDAFKELFASLGSLMDPATASSLMQMLGQGSQLSGTTGGNFNQANQAQAQQMDQLPLFLQSLQQGQQGLQSAASGQAANQAFGKAEGMLQSAGQNQFANASQQAEEAAIAQGIPTQSTGFVNTIGQLSGNIGQGINQSLAGLLGQSTPAAIQAQLAGSQGLAQLGSGGLSQMINPAISAGLNNSQFQQQFPLQVAGATQGTPLYQPSSQPGKGEGIAGIALPLAAAAMTGGASAAIPAVAGAAGAGKGGGGGGKG